jgi:hypothetical protein
MEKFLSDNLSREMAIKSKEHRESINGIINSAKTEVLSMKREHAEKIEIEVMKAEV